MAKEENAISACPFQGFAPRVITTGDQDRKIGNQEDKVTRSKDPAARVRTPEKSPAASREELA